MPFKIEAACLCSRGKIRRNNEDNYLFNGRCLPERNKGLERPISMRKALWNDLFVAVFDGMGGENFGETAAYTAAETMKLCKRSFIDHFFHESLFLNRTCTRLNEAVLARAAELQTSRMGSTLVALMFSSGAVFCCNLGDSRAYLLRNGALRQLSVDHVEKREGKKKTPLTQHLGIDPEDFLIEPSISEHMLRRGDQYLLCSDGLTDLLSDEEIDGILKQANSAKTCAQSLVDAALERGGRDNVTVIVCRIH